MATPTTALLALVAVGVAVWAIGVSRTRNAVGSAAGRTRSAVTRGRMEILGGLGAGVMLGDQLVSAALSNPFGVTTIVAGVMGALGIEGILEPITGPQFLLIGFVIFVAVAMIRGR
jgi:hypothetical protein